MASYHKNEDWRLIAEQVSNETNPAKLTLLVAQLCRALDGKRESTSQRQQVNESEFSHDAALVFGDNGTEMPSGNSSVP